MSRPGAHGQKAVTLSAASFCGAAALALGLAGTLACPASGGEGLAAGAKVKVGVVLELTGPEATFGEETKNGLDMAMEDLKDKAPWSIELVTLDNKSEAQETVRAVQQLTEVHKVTAIIGAVASTNTMAGGKIAQENETPMTSPGSTNVNVTLRDKGGKKVRAEYMSRVCFIDPFQGEVCARFAAKELGKKRAALVIDKASDYAIGLAAAFRETWTKGGGTIVGEESYVKKESDFSAVIRKVADQKPDVIFIPGYYGDVGPMLKQALELWKGIPKLGGDGWDSPDLFALGGPAALQDCYVSSHYAPDDQAPIVKAFVERYRKRFNKEPGSMCVLGYDAGLFIHDAIRRAGSADPVKVKDAINATKDLAGVSGAITIDESGNPRKDAVILKLEDGRFKFRARIKPGGEG